MFLVYKPALLLLLNEPREKERGVEWRLAAEKKRGSYIIFGHL